MLCERHVNLAEVHLRCPNSLLQNLLCELAEERQNNSSKKKAERTLRDNSYLALQ